MSNLIEVTLELDRLRGIIRHAKENENKEPEVLMSYLFFVDECNVSGAIKQFVASRLKAIFNVSEVLQ